MPFKLNIGQETNPHPIKTFMRFINSRSTNLDFVRDLIGPHQTLSQTIASTAGLLWKCNLLYFQSIFDLPTVTRGELMVHGRVFEAI